jgi:hypothetical protein
MRKLSTGQDSTLGEYRKLTVALLGEDSPAVKFLDERITESPVGKKDEDIADEGQMIHLLMSMHNDEEVKRDLENR